MTTLVNRIQEVINTEYPGLGNISISSPDLESFVTDLDRDVIVDWVASHYETQIESYENEREILEEIESKKQELIELEQQLVQKRNTAAPADWNTSTTDTTKEWSASGTGSSSGSGVVANSVASVKSAKNENWY